ncbi:MAG: hypothetical protein Q8O67_12610 [Deltaproteobacteria bacterium]|nr:hypothetical protein [Deltaproteobacteria bacterium]
MIKFSFVVVVVVALASACGGKLADCEQIAADQAACMPESAVEDCEAANTECADGGEVLTLESCPLQFTCSRP